jgi:hypothetical protein
LRGICIFFSSLREFIPSWVLPCWEDFIFNYCLMQLLVFDLLKSFVSSLFNFYRSRNVSISSRFSSLLEFNIQNIPL